MPKFTPSVNEIAQKVGKLLRKYINFRVVLQKITIPGKKSAIACRDGRDKSHVCTQILHNNINTVIKCFSCIDLEAIKYRGKKRKLPLSLNFELLSWRYLLNTWRLRLNHVNVVYVDFIVVVDVDFDFDFYVDVDVDKVDCPTQLTSFVRFDLCICVS